MRLPVAPAVTASRATVPLAVATAVVILDQVTKALIVRAIGPGRPSHGIDLLPPLLGLEYVENRGAAFGVLRGQGALLSLLALVVLVGLVAYYRRLAEPIPSVSFGVGLIAGGAVGNLIDRVRLGYVVDFVAVGPWPKFNVADSAITLGVLLFAYRVLFGRTDARGAQPEPPGPHGRSQPSLPADG